MSKQSEKLYDGITNIREELVEQAERKKNPAWKRRGMRAAAAVLALVFVLGVLLNPGGGGGTVASAYTIAEAKYPKNADVQKPPKDYADGLEGYFAASIRQFLAGAETANKVYSPVNVYMALAMLAEVTGGSSRQQILDLLGSGSIEALRTQAASVWNAQYRDGDAVTSILASSLWLNEDVSFVQSTMDTLAETYYASSYRGEMGSDGFNRALQSWLNEQTRGLLTEQAGQIELSADTILAIAAAIYYKAPWNNDFNKERTTQDVFHAVGGDVTCDFMHQTVTGTYYWGERFSAVRRSMAADGGAMWFILPDEGYTPADLLVDEQAMTFMLDRGDWENNKYLMVNQSIPKFDVTSQIDLRAGLQALGVTDVFDPGLSDYTPMTTERSDIFLSKAQHDARVIIDEEGVEAAAYTVLANPSAGMPPQEEIDFVVDRPFLFVITGADSLPLFVGVVNQP